MASDYEARIFRLEAELARLKRLLADLANKAGKAEQDQQFQRQAEGEESGDNGFRVGKAPTGIPAMSGSTPGKKTDVEVYDHDPVANTLTLLAEDQTVFNTAGAVATGAWIQLKIIQGSFFVNVEKCE